MFQKWKEKCIIHFGVNAGTLIQDFSELNVGAALHLFNRELLSKERERERKREGERETARETRRERKRERQRERKREREREWERQRERGRDSEKEIICAWISGGSLFYVRFKREKIQKYIITKMS